MYFSVNMKLLPMKLHYFLFNLGTGPIVANLSIIARQKGFSPFVVGVLLTSLYLVATISKPIVGWLADRFRMHKFIFILMQGVTATTFLSIFFIPPFTNEVIVKTINNNTTMFFCPKNPIWDKCLYERIYQSTSEIFKCQLVCKIEPWVQNYMCNNNAERLCVSKTNILEFEIFLDKSTVEINKKCLTVHEYKLNETNQSSITTYLFDQSYEIFCDALCEKDFLKGCLQNRGAIPDTEITHYYQFWLFCGLLLIGYSTNSVVISMADTICFNLLGENTRVYGRQRMWDAIGWGIAAVMIGSIIDKISGDSVFKDYTIVYFFCFITVCINMICSTKLSYTQAKKSENIWKDVAKLWKSIKFLTFFFWCCCGGFFSAVVWNFILWHLEELSDKFQQDNCEGNYVKTLEGIDVVIQCAGEVPFFYWAGFILKKLGHMNSMHVTLLIFAVRFFYYPFLVNPWWVLPIEALNGVTYGLLYSTMASYANIIAPKGTEATLQGVVGALFEGVGISLGNFTAGTLFNSIGGSEAFMNFAIIAVFSLTIHILLRGFACYCSKNVKIISKNDVVDIKI